MKEVQSGGTASSSFVSATLPAEQPFESVFAAKPRAGCHEAARLPVSEALDATSKVALSVSADKSGEILPPSSAVSSSLIDAQPVRQLPALQKYVA